MVVLKLPSKKPELLIGSRWDKLRTWQLLKDEIEAKLQEPEKFDSGITLDIGPQVNKLTHYPRKESLCHMQAVKIQIRPN